MKTYTFQVVIEPDEDRWRAYSPELEEYGGATRAIPGRMRRKTSGKCWLWCWKLCSRKTTLSRKRRRIRAWPWRIIWWR